MTRRPNAARRLEEAFTEDEVPRADAFLEAGRQETTASPRPKPDSAKDAADDEAWLVQQLTTAWARLDELLDRIDDVGSLMANTHVASAVGYVRGSRPVSEAPADEPALP
ncbi:hypothetical protein [Streptomyces virginiae]|uniref:hypothetical protein n=1 Tax=Streptomyces virginiae TaxID=1961 RepID=UPI0036FCB865